MADRKRILVADDDPDMLDLIKINLTYQGYEVLVATNGNEAVKIAMSEPLDLVLLDIMMPYIDGYHVAYELSSKMGAKCPRIAIFTSRDAVREKAAGLVSGALEIIQKPFEMNELDERVAAILAKPLA